MQIGDLVETCGLEVGVITEIEGDDVTMDIVNHLFEKVIAGSSCSLEHCGLTKLTHEQARTRLAIPLEIRKKLYSESSDDTHYEKLISEYVMRVI